MQKWIKDYKLLRYLIAGGTAAGVNLGVLFLCVQYLKMWYLVGTIISFCFGVTTSYVLQKFWTFKDNSRENIHTQFIYFVIFALLMLGVNTLLMYFFVDILHIWYMLSQAISAVLIAFINYNVFKRFMFKIN